MGRWHRKFANAFRGLWLGCKGQDSFYVHGLASIAVVGLAAILRLDATSWCLLLLCIGVVWSAELFNTAIEILVQRLHPQHDPAIGQALDIAAAAVLVVSLAAAVVGAIILLRALLPLLLG